ncbi:glycosyltransferase [Nakamurella lactea]|uniref:glycosyltransferase n=1 Tax=Nakamurella lactea TaxID=459515 RepID=UPI000404123F|nr:nucleotide disphospho-sugar-binding domain-containing protein [Nakamurella lactea]
MTRILITTMPMAGHLQPLAPLAARLVADGHDVLWYTGRKYGPAVERTGARFQPYALELDWDDARLYERPAGTGLKQLRADIRDVFILPIPQHMADLAAVFDEFAPEVIVAEQGFMAGPLAGEQRGIGSVVVAILPLGITSVDTAPFGLGKPPATDAVGRLRNRLLNAMMKKVVFGEGQQLAERLRREAGLPALSDYFMDWGVRVAERYLSVSIPEIEYPRRDLPANVSFVGPMLPEPGERPALPSWWGDVATARAAGRPVVLVTQGTIATDPNNLVLPSVRALAGDDALVVGTTAGYDPAVVLPVDQRPANLRLEAFVPFTELLPMTDLMITNGGWGGVQMALAHGVPLIVAGTTEDKMEVSGRVRWSGAGLTLDTDTPSVAQLTAAVGTVLGTDSYRECARRLMKAYARYSDATERAAAHVLAVADRTADATAARAQSA